MKKLIVYYLILGTVVMFLPGMASAGTADSMLWGGYEDPTQQATGLGNADPREMAGSVVKIFLGFLGIIFLLIIIFGVVRGAISDDGFEKSKGMISAGVIGLIIVLMAFGLAQFVISALYGATGATG